VVLAALVLLLCAWGASSLVLTLTSTIAKSLMTE
jgi:hypothetical protein